MTSLVVVTWNLQGRNPTEVGLRSAVADWRADVIVLQEANGATVRSSLPPTFQSLRAWASAGTSPGMVLATHLPLLESGVLDPADPPWDRPRACWARLDTGGGPLTVVAVHLLAPLLPGARSRRDAQREALVGWSDGLVADGELLVVGGDFNSRDPRLGGLADACVAQPTATWRPLAVSWMPPMLRLDAIFVSPRLNLLSGRVDDRWRGSDHLPVVAHVEW